MKKIGILLCILMIGFSYGSAVEILSLNSSNFTGITGIRNWYPDRLIDGSVEGDDNAGVSSYANLGDTFYYEFSEEMAISRVRIGRREGAPTSKWYFNVFDNAGSQTYYYDVLDNNPRLSNLWIMDISFSPVYAKKIVFGHIQVTNSNDRATWSEVELYGSSIPEPATIILFCLVLFGFIKKKIL